MTNSNYTALVLIVDRSGSMHSIAQQTQEALEELVNGQKQEPGKLTIDTVFFDDHYDERAHFVNPKRSKLDLAIRPGGMTALFDAVGRKVTSFGEALEALPEDKRPGTVIVVIATDGDENASKEYENSTVADLIKQQQEDYGWKFTFIGANQDAVLAAQRLNINANDAITFAANALGTQNVMSSVSGYISRSRMGSNEGYSQEDRISAVSNDESDFGAVVAATPSKGGRGKTAAPHKK